MKLNKMIEKYQQMVKDGYETVTIIQVLLDLHTIEMSRRARK